MISERALTECCLFTLRAKHLAKNFLFGHINSLPDASPLRRLLGLQDFLVVFGFQFPFHQGGDGFFGRNFAIE
jgi:hypothetical protein